MVASSGILGCGAGGVAGLGAYNGDTQEEKFMITHYFRYNIDWDSVVIVRSRSGYWITAAVSAIGCREYMIAVDEHGIEKPATFNSFTEAFEVIQRGYLPMMGMEWPQMTLPELQIGEAFQVAELMRHVEELAEFDYYLGVVSADRNHA